MNYEREWNDIERKLTRGFLVNLEQIAEGHRDITWNPRRLSFVDRLLEDKGLAEFEQLNGRGREAMTIRITEEGKEFYESLKSAGLYN